MTTFDMAKKYYPTFWNKEMLQMLVDKKRLTKSEMDKIIKEGKK